MQDIIPVLTIFCITAVVAQQIITVTPNYDFRDEKVKLYNISWALVLKCNVSIDGVFEIEWWKDGLNVKEVPSLSNRYKIYGNEFRVDRTIGDDAGFYDCIFPDIGANATIEVIANVYVRLPKETPPIFKGETLKINCRVVGTNPEISWIIGNENYTESRGRVLIETPEGAVNNTQLVINNVTMKDRNVYTCVGRNKASDLLRKPQNYSTMVRVHSKNAAVWPFLGICVEVVLVWIVIWISERHRLRKLEAGEEEEVEEDDDYEPPVKSNNGGDLRQRR